MSHQTQLPDNPSAFPYCVSTGDPRDGVSAESGMNLRDFFAAHALMALPHYGCGADLDVESIGQAAFQLADEMLKARETPIK